MTDSIRGVLALLAAAVLGVAMAVHVQTLQIGLIAVATTIALVAATASRAVPSLDETELYRVLPLFVGGVSASIFVLQVFEVFPGTTGVEALVRLAGCASVVTLAMFTLVGRGDRWVEGGLVAAYTMTMVALIVFTPDARSVMDVAAFQEDGVAALLRGDNPFALVFNDIYPPRLSAMFYAPGLSVDGVLQFGYPYFPLSLLVIAPFEVVGDFRLAHLAAIIASAILMLRMSAQPLARMAAIVLLLASPSILTVRLGWMDPLVLVTIVVVVAVAVRSAGRRPDRVSATMGLIFAMKQYAAFLAVPALLLVERPWTIRTVVRHFAIAAAVFLLVTLPFALWDFGAFWWSTIELQLVQPYRPDSIALPGLLPGVWESLSPFVTVGGPVIVVIMVSVIVALRTPTGGQGFALGAGLILAVAFATSKQAFSNYYFVVLGTLCAAAAAAQPAVAAATESEV